MCVKFCIEFKSSYRPTFRIKKISFQKKKKNLDKSALKHAAKPRAE